LTGKVRCVTELTARNAGVVERAGPGRPGFWRVFFLTLLGGTFGALAAALFSAVVGVVGVASPPLWDRDVPYVATGFGPIAADVAGVLYVAVFAVAVTRWFLREWVQEPPAWTWTVATLIPAAGLAALAPSIDTSGGWAIAGVALRYVAWDSEGHARRDPFAMTRRMRLALVLTPALLLAVVTGYAMFHPLRLSTGGSHVIASGTSTLAIDASIDNDGGRPVRILAVEPGRERGYALHLTGVRSLYEGARPIGAPDSHPFTPVVIAPHGTASLLVLQVSRAGCRRGSSGRIETIRVRYALGGVHVMELPLDPVPALTC
jgi:hypothetical protein